MPSLHDETARFLQAWMGVRQIVQSANFKQFHRAGLSATQFVVINAMTASEAEMSGEDVLSEAGLDSTIVSANLPAIHALAHAARRVS